MKRVSVVVTNYNYAGYMAECLHSIHAQTYRDFHLVVVDDASTDNSVEVIRAFRPDVLISLKENVGTVHASNIGVRALDTELCCLVNADDLIEPEYLERCVAALESDPQSAIAYTDFWHFGGELNNGVQFPEYSFETLCKWNYILASALFRRQAFEQAGGFNSDQLGGMEDYDLWLAICKNGWSAKRVSGYLYKYRAHTANRSNSMDIDNLAEQIFQRHGLKASA